MPGRKYRASIRASAGLALVLALLAYGCGSPPSPALIKPLARPAVNPLEAAIHRVEEDRGEPVGNKAQITVPAELQHYRDRRRFLAVQVAEWRKQAYALPHDYAELIKMIRQKQFVEMPPLGEDYILYGVGKSANDGPFTHYDRATGEQIPLYADISGFEAEYKQITDTAEQRRNTIAELREQLKKTGKRDRQCRKDLLAQIAASRKALAGAEKQAQLLASFYKAPDWRNYLLTEYRQLAEVAADFEGQAYDLQDPADRKRFKVRLLSFIRPEGRDALIEIARAYRSQFDRRLPITSLVRTEGYQRQLSAGNRNATRIAAPPHATGLAFDIYNYYMTAAEQDFLMAEIARLEAAGRVEALRENRDHIHVFAFAQGRPPAESLIAGSLDQTRAAGPAKGAAAHSLRASRRAVAQSGGSTK